MSYFALSIQIALLFGSNHTCILFSKIYYSAHLRIVHMTNDGENRSIEIMAQTFNDSNTIGKTSKTYNKLMHHNENISLGTEWMFTWNVCNWIMKLC